MGLRLFFIAFISLLATTLCGQGVIVDQPRMLFANEQTFGAFLNSNGIGGEYRFAKYIDARNDRLFELGLHYVEHPKEYKSVVNFDFYTRRFVYGKKNLFWEFQALYGNQHEVFRKYDLSSISIRLYYTGGISFGFLKPIYYEILTFNGVGTIESREEKVFDPSIHLYNYGGTASFTKGLNEVKVVPGITVRSGFSFEYSEREPMVHALDVGIGLTAYPRSMEIMATDQRQYLFFKMFVGYRFGTLLDISESARAKSLKERRQERQEAAEEAQMPRR